VEISSNDRDGRQGPERLRIMQLATTGLRGGVASMVTGLAAELQSQGHEVLLVTNGGDVDTLRRRGVECVVTNLWQQPGAFVLSTLAIHSALRRFRPHVVHVHGRSVALRCYLAGRAPDWFTLHSTLLTHQVSPIDFGPFRRALSPFARRFFVLDDLARAYLEDELGVAKSRIRLVRNGVDCTHFREPSPEERRAARAHFGVGDGETLVIFVGRLYPCKQPGAIVAAAKALRDQGRSSVRFAIIGDGELRGEVQAAIDAAGVASTCTIQGWIDPLRAYFAADLLALPSLTEGFALVAAEAMATGCPVLRTRTGGSDWMIREGETGFTSSTDEKDFVDTLSRVLEHPEQLTRMRRAARAWAQTRLDARGQVEEIVRLYRSELRGVA
jgi:glycosyltransferase involved in cell wall biosynthesis